MRVLAFESSCDETSVSILDGNKIRANLISSQDFHTLYGGVVPELSSRAHIQRINPLLKDAFEISGLTIDDIDIVAATAGPGLIGALMIGLIYAKGLAYSTKKKFIPVNHIEGHTFSGFLMDEKPQFPFVCLMVSGGHSLLFFVESTTNIQLLGTTIDDAVGEAFDKVAKLLDLGYPGGPMIQRYAGMGKKGVYIFPKANVKGKYDFSFSGLKTSVLRQVQKLKTANSILTEEQKSDISLAFQESAVSALIEKTKLAIIDYKPASITLVGGVAANTALRSAFFELGKSFSVPAIVPHIEFCGDNGAMIAYRAKTLVEAGLEYGFDYEAFPSFTSQFITS